MSQMSPALRPSVSLSISKLGDTQEAGLDALSPCLPWGCGDSGRQPIYRKPAAEQCPGRRSRSLWGGLFPRLLN